MDRVKVGVIGIGNMGSSIVNWMNQVPAAELVAVCDLNPKAFDRINADIRDKVQKFTTDEEFFEKSGVDLVMIEVPHFQHADLAIMAMNHGMHFNVEKPLCVHKADAERLLAECAKHPELVKGIMLNQRTRDAHIKIKNLIESGDLGEIRRVNWIITDWYRTQYYYDSGDWRASWRGEGGGVLTNQCPHQLDLMTWLFGMPKLVDAHIFLGKYHDIEVEDEVNAYLEYPNGATGNFITTTGEAPGTNRLEIAAEHGRIVFEDSKLLYKRHAVATQDDIRNSKNAFRIPETWDCEIHFDPDYGTAQNQHMRVLANVCDAILHGAALRAPVEEGIKGLELANAMMLSGFLKKPVTLPLDSSIYAAKLQELIATSRYPKKVVADNSGAADGFSSSF